MKIEDFLLREGEGKVARGFFSVIFCKKRVAVAQHATMQKRKKNTRLLAADRRHVAKG